ncbi:hypothetical protein [Streptomyces sp. GSL17-111]|uniref:hypothetical protein n=1 Tax=Streptomyces sp. GSL17-111 TaxID=3121596 RepID=UPI0030F47C28
MPILKLEADLDRATEEALPPMRHRVRCGWPVQRVADGMLDADLGALSKRSHTV